MKTKFFFLIIAAAFMLVACKEDVPATSMPEISAEQADLVTTKIIYEGYLPLIDGQYVLKMSEAEAEKVGITKETYRYFRDQVEKGNAMMKEMDERLRNDPSITSIGEMEDQNETYKSQQKPVSEATRATLPNGNLIISDEEPEASVVIPFTPFEMKFIDCDCYSGLFVNHTVYTETMGATRSGVRFNSGPLKVEVGNQGGSCKITYRNSARSGNLSWRGVSR